RRIASAAKPANATKVDKCFLIVMTPQSWNWLWTVSREAAKVAWPGLVRSYNEDPLDPRRWILALTSLEKSLLRTSIVLPVAAGRDFGRWREIFVGRVPITAKAAATLLSHSLCKRKA